MPDEDFYHDALDAWPADEAARWLLADWLGDRGDPRGGCYSWMVEHAKYTTVETRFAAGSTTWEWWSMLPGWQRNDSESNNGHDRLPRELMEALRQFSRKSNWSDKCAFCEYFTRRDAEESLCRALRESGWLERFGLRFEGRRQSKRSRRR